MILEGTRGGGGYGQLSNIYVIDRIIKQVHSLKGNKFVLPDWAGGKVALMT